MDKFQGIAHRLLAVPGAEFALTVRLIVFAVLARESSRGISSSRMCSSILSRVLDFIGRLRLVGEMRMGLLVEEAGGALGRVF